MRYHRIARDFASTALRFALVSLILVIATTMCGFGCKDRGGGTTSGYGNGYIDIDVTPDHVDAPWDLSEPEWGSHWEGTGDYSFDHMVPENYTIIWGEVPGYTMQGDSLQTLYVYDGATTVFEQTYVADEDLTRR